jgi:hypothetical protein
MTVWILSFRAEGDGPPVEVRVRRLLKAALRCYRLRCIDAKLADNGYPPHGQKREGPGVADDMEKDR